MNKLQRAGTAIAVVLWLWSLAAAPWESQSLITDRAHGKLGDYLFRIEWCPVVDPPASQHGPPRLRLDVLTVEWIAIGLFAVGVVWWGRNSQRKDASSLATEGQAATRLPLAPASAPRQMRVSTAVALCVVVVVVAVILTKSLSHAPPPALRGHWILEKKGNPYLAACRT